ncbi:MAG TPA: TlpA disulfide reductase family protein [Acidimicrobiales bacterium]|nr:TlpA disulfide reductase family protein [Acidimicrobiales bacterium]
MPDTVAGGVTARRAVAIAAGLIAVALAVAVFVSRSEPASDGAATRLAPAFSLPELREGRPDVVLAAVPGTPTVVNFFAAWCEPCKEELPVLREAALRHEGSVAFVGVDHQDSRADAIEQVERFRMPYPAGYDPRGDVAARYGLRGLPGTVFITADGRILEAHQGALDAEGLESRIRRLTLQSKAS